MIEKRALQFFEQICNGFGPPGFEREVLRAVRDYVTPFAEDVRQDKMGSLLYSAKGSASSPVIFMPGHVDEVGFIVTGINDKGFLSFNPLGGWFDQVLLGQRVTVRTHLGDHLGIIASKPPHLLPADVRNKVVEKDSMFIDLGCSNRKEAEAMGVRVGDPVVPRSTFSTMEKRVFEKVNGVDTEKGTMTMATGKAFDDRVGAFVAAEVVRALKEQGNRHPNTLIGAATVQEEVGVRGATTAGWLADPDVVLALEADISGDVPGIEPHQAPAIMGKGPSILTYDASMIPNQALKDFAIDTAEKAGIPYQLSTIARGGTDAGAVHKLRAGCPGLVLAIPTRHIHSHVAILSLTDIENGVRLLTEMVRGLDAKRVEDLTRL